MNPGDLAPAALASPRLQAQIAFARDANGATYVQRQRVGYPFHVGRKLSMPGDPAGMPTVYLQSCAGGIFEGDDLGLSIQAGEGAAAHVSTGAATVVHSMEAGNALQRTAVRVDAGAYLEFLPDPLILFPRARLASILNVTVCPGATAIFGDAILLHDPAGGDAHFDRYDADTIIDNAAGKVLARDRFRIDGGQLSRRLPGVTGNWRAQASLYVVAPGAEGVIGAMREALGIDGVYAGVSLLPNQSGAWARMLATDAAALRAALFAAWSAARRILTGTAPMPRRK